jgi:hypothetical protein
MKKQRPICYTIQRPNQGDVMSLPDGYESLIVRSLEEHLALVKKHIASYGLFGNDRRYSILVVPASNHWDFMLADKLTTIDRNVSEDFPYLSIDVFQVPRFDAVPHHPRVVHVVQNHEQLSA